MKLFDTAIILAGGKSSRMGFDKKYLKTNNEFLIQSLIKKLKTVFNEIIIVSNELEKIKNNDYILVEDEVEKFGPLGGFHVGLKESSSLFNYIIACDMPNINIDYINYMKDIILKDKDNIYGVVSVIKDKFEPFNGFYSKNLLPKIEENIKNNIRKISSIYDGSNIFFIREYRIKEFDYNLDMFINLNNSNDVKDYREKLNKSMNKR